MRLRTTTDPDGGGDGEGEETPVVAHGEGEEVGYVDGGLVSRWWDR